MDREKFLKRLEHFRSEDRHECNLISARMGWLLAGQSFLITAYAIANNHSNPWFRIGCTIILFIVGEYFTRKLGDAIRAAHAVINAWHAREKQLEAELDGSTDVDRELRSYFIGRKWAATPRGDDPIEPHGETRILENLGPAEFLKNLCGLQQMKRTSEDLWHDNSFEFQRNIYWVFLRVWIALLALSVILSR
jgi:hypothetical protein